MVQVGLLLGFGLSRPRQEEHRARPTTLDLPVEESPPQCSRAGAFTTNLPSAIDRLVHHCVILELNIPSYRVEQAKKAKQEATA